VRRCEWDLRTKARIILERLNGNTAIEPFTERWIRQTRYRRWTNRLLTKVEKASGKIVAEKQKYPFLREFPQGSSLIRRVNSGSRHG
jgi:hypothetical protein